MLEDGVFLIFVETTEISCNSLTNLCKQYHYWCFLGIPVLINQYNSLGYAIIK
ncbi:hypothetical protein G163CM_10250 [Pseudocitrobacter corydidari]|uniref:Transposase n=1 Tax=Pseudocitrobacter corydidari TaxID=2891570 RepID=A0ABY3S3Q0_9ENTR|nr:hypothetical protein G163CM_10250 [Pseudocitrobacter corydidari]